MTELQHLAGKSLPEGYKLSLIHISSYCFLLYGNISLLKTIIANNETVLEESLGIIFLASSIIDCSVVRSCTLNLSLIHI